MRPLLALALAAFPAAASAQGFQSTQLLDQAVQQFTGAGIGTEGGAAAPVDRRLKLAACPLPQLDWRTEAHDAVVVRCMAPVWRIFVPVRQPARAPAPVSVAQRAPAPAKPAPVIRRGDPVTVEAGAAGFSITREGVAMGDAAAGGRLAVRVDPAKPPIQAVALEPGRAALPGFEG